MTFGHRRRSRFTRMHGWLQSCKKHVIYPREHSKYLLSRSDAVWMLEQWLYALAAKLDLLEHVLQHALPPCTHYLGVMPTSIDLRFQGTSPCCAENIVVYGCEPKAYKRRGQIRRKFRKKCFHVANYFAASRWSQYVDIGYLRRDFDISKCGKP